MLNPNSTLSSNRSSSCKLGYLSHGFLDRSHPTMSNYSTWQRRTVNAFSVSRLLQLRNPWGNHSWKGDWNFASRLWTPQLLEKLKPPKEDNGTFWISFQDTVKYFSSAEI
ncbi:unnamed protein product, partial [Allacma fusca]